MLTLREARRKNIEYFLANCRNCGPALFRTDLGGCTICYENSINKGLPSRIASIAAAGDRYFKTCPTHGENSPHYVAGNRCALCVHPNGVPRASVSTSRRAEARREGRTRYLDTCPTHGEAEHHVNSGKCLICYTSSGGLRTRGGSSALRAAARREGRTTYVDTCPTHGETDFHVNSGKCLTCFSATGVKRSDKRARHSPRAAARRAGERTYRGRCSVHGETDFHVNSGKCLTCFSATGAKRPDKRASRSPRAVARRAGERTYRGRCSVHGRTDFHVNSGKCLTCYTPTGKHRLDTLAVRLAEAVLAGEDAGELARTVLRVTK